MVFDKRIRVERDMLTAFFPGLVFTGLGGLVGLTG
jgi:hypothetical protein